MPGATAFFSWPSRGTVRAYPADEASIEASERAITDFLVDVFATSDPDESHGEEITAREILERGAGRIERELAQRPETQARLLGIIGEVYSRLGLYDRSLPLLERALDQVLGLARDGAPGSPGATGAVQISIISKSSLPAPHSGHFQFRGTSSQRVPGARPSSGQPFSYS